MSMLLMVKAMQTKVGNPLRKLVLIKLADNANDQGECWPSYQHIADQCEISRSTVKTHIRELESCGLLIREFRKNGHINKSNIFHLKLSGAADNLGRQITEGGAADNLGGGAADNPRISNSLEPVIEPLRDLVSNVKNVLPQHEQTGYFLILKDGTNYEPPASQVIRWRELYQNVDITAELKAMIGWLDANPSKRKTKTGIKRFCNAWLSRSDKQPKRTDWDAVARDTTWADDLGECF